MSTIEIVRAVVAQRAKAFETSMTSDPSQGRIRPVGYGPWLAAVMADFQKSEDLRKCAEQAPESVLECLSVAANCGLIPGSAAGKFYLIPRWSGRRQRVECTFIIGYKGLAELAYRHPRVHKCEAFVVYEGEPFDHEPGSGKLMHKWRMDVDRSDDKIVAAYSRVVLTVPGGTHVDQEPLARVMTRKELEAIRDRSDGWRAFKAGKIKDTPYASDTAAMFRKAPMRSHFSGGSVPQSNDMIVAVSAENDHEEALKGDVMLPAQKAAVGLRSALGLSVEEAPAADPVPDADQWAPVDRDKEGG